MSQHYSDPRREDEPFALPDIETFYVDDADVERMEQADEKYDDDHGIHETGWYWWFCFPGCLPDGGPNGPFAAEEDALADARDGLDFGEED